MKQTVTKEDFFQAFKDYDREDNFSSQGLSALFDWLEDYAEDTGEEIELDVIALCCDFQEDTYEYFAATYDVDIEEVQDFLHENTLLIEVDDETCIIQTF